MTIETKSPAIQLALTGKARIAVTHLERFAQREDPITAAQAKPIDDALLALSAALLAAGIGGAPSDPASATVKDGASVSLRNSAGAALTGSGVVSVANSAVTGVKLPATIAPVTSGLVAGVAATGTGTKVTLTVSGGKISAVALSE